MRPSSRVRGLAKISSLIGSNTCCNREISVVEVASRCLVLIALTTCFIFAISCINYTCHVAEEDLFEELAVPDFMLNSIQALREALVMETISIYNCLALHMHFSVKFLVVSSALQIMPTMR